eukprot:768600-Hanusia_phi.AAC.4
MKGAIKKAEDILASLGENAWMPQQFNNPDNIKVHMETTGPEVGPASTPFMNPSADPPSFLATS